MAGASLKYRRGSKAIHDVLIREWDPIGVADVPQAQDEYDSYIPVIYRLLAEGSELGTIAGELGRIQTEAMGISSNQDHDIRIAKRLREVFESVPKQP